MINFNLWFDYHKYRDTRYLNVYLLKNCKGKNAKSMFELIFYIFTITPYKIVYEFILNMIYSI